MDGSRAVYKQGTGTRVMLECAYLGKENPSLSFVLLINSSELNMSNLKTSIVCDYRQYKILTVDGEVV